ncbi:hypothetical protein [uncultured Roseibium sp.]|uniref:hypothetical protein n=1 Tax=uncultured Roseibium sp. TaxID=1936171 RepID=UPI003216CE8E
MGTLLDFASAPRPASRVRTSHNSAGSSMSEQRGEVILFPGVRYEKLALDLSARIGTIGHKAGPAVPDRD